jgi:hypothetical protein
LAECRLTGAAPGGSGGGGSAHFGRPPCPSDGPDISTCPSDGPALSTCPFDGGSAHVGRPAGAKDSDVAAAVSESAAVSSTSDDTWLTPVETLTLSTRSQCNGRERVGYRYTGV